MDLSGEQQAQAFRDDFARIRAEIQRMIVGQQEVVDAVLTCLLANGHVLLEGVPGLGKTLLVRTLSEVLDLEFQRIQFTPDLMPADIIGTNMVMESAEGRRYFEFQQGPVFANIILADEVNRATPKTQSAMLEAMQEHSVTVAGVTHHLPEPYVVMATQNPLEMEGTYPLPEAQLDRFMFKVLVPFPSREDLSTIMFRTTGTYDEPLRKIVGADRLNEMRALVRQVPIADYVQDYAVRLVLATHPDSPLATASVRQYIAWGSSPRGAQALTLAAKTRALLTGRFNVSFEDIQAAAKSSLRHRIIRNFEGEAERMAPDRIVEEILEHVPTTAEPPEPADIPVSAEAEV